MKASNPEERFSAMRRWAILGKAFLVGLICWLILLHFAMKILVVNRPLANADWIVVLGGESGERVIGAAELYHDDVASRIFVTGRGDCERNVHLLQVAGVPAANITSECTSWNTYQNARYTKRFISPSNPQKVILVTSWFHSARALRIFSQVWPTVQFGTLGVVPSDTSYDGFPLAEAGAITIEYLKSAWYLMRYGL